MKKQISLYSEHQIQTQIINYLKATGWSCMRLNSGKYSVGEGRYKRFIQGQEKGTPDILAFKPIAVEGEKIKGLSKLLFIEVKKPKTGILSKLQEYRINELKQFGINTIVSTSIEDL